MSLEIETDGRGVRTLWLNRPEKHNAMDAALMDALTAAAGDVRVGEVRVLVLAARGPTFCAGGDLKWMRAQFEAAPAERRAEAERLSDMLHALYNVGVPVIGRIHGNAFGGGVGLTAICDHAVGVAGRSFGLTETRLGLIPATIGPYVAARLGHKLGTIFMSSRVFEAEEAKELGLLAKVVTEDGLDAAIEAEIAPYLACAPGAVAAAKQQARSLANQISPATTQAALDALTARWESGEAAEGIAAFFEKRAPSWKAP